MKKITFICLLALYGNVNAQGVTQSADGKGTVLLSGAAISVDAGKTDLAFTINNLNNIAVKKNNFAVFGVDVHAKNKEGIGNLFSKGNKVAEGKLNLFLGYNFSNAILESSTVVKNENDYNSFKADLINNIKAEVINVANRYSKLIKDKTKKDNEVNALSKFFDDGFKKGYFAKAIAASIKTDDTDSEVKDFRTKAKIDLVNFTEEIDKTISFDAFRHNLVEAYKEQAKSSFYNVVFFGFGGIDASSFKRVTKIDSADLSNSFKSEDYQGGNFGGGVNVEYRNMRLGLTYAYVKTNNLSLLTATDYTLKQATTDLTGQTLTSEDKITAYTGNYGTVEVNELNADLIYNFKLDKQANTHLLVNPYFRGTLFSRDTSLLINKINLGIGGYIFKKDGGFLGGLYVELPDVANNREKAKPLEKQNLLPPFKRLTFGIVAKFNLTSLRLGW